MADRSINELSEASVLLDEGLTVVYQNSQTQKIAGSALKTYAQQAVVDYAQQAADIATADAIQAASDANAAKSDAEAAQAAAETAETNAASSATTAGNEATAAAESASDAEAAKQAILDMTVDGTTLAPGSPVTVTKSTSGGVVNLSFGIPQGNVGETGVITSITRTSGNGSPGTTDTYTIETNYGDTFTFQVYNGADGTGAVVSVNGQSGTVTLTKADIGLGNVDNVRQYSATNPPPYPVTSVNGQTGAVTVEAGTDETAVNNLINAKINRTTAVNAADTNYTTYMARGQAIVTEETTPTVNGAIAWLVE